MDSESTTDRIPNWNLGIDGEPDTDTGSTIDGEPDTDTGPTIDGEPDTDTGPTIDDEPDTDTGPTIDDEPDTDAGSGFADGSPGETSTRAGRGRPPSERIYRPVENHRSMDRRCRPCAS